ncbi:MAG: YlxM family DNA-binding protein [Oscillospiraceae bacterium]
MSKNFQISVLFDFYGDMLTEKQREAIELYYNADLSLGEISDNLGITRQGVRDNIKRSEAILIEFEERLGLVRKWDEMEQSLQGIIENANNILSCAFRYSLNSEIELNAKEIIKTAKSLYE